MIQTIDKQLKPSKDIHVIPTDVYNKKLIYNTHPSEWINPQPSAKYDLVVIGAGTAGLVAAEKANALGANVALIERGLMGGDSLNYGSIPSKSLIRSSKVAYEIINAYKFGISSTRKPQVVFEKVMERVRKIRSEISYKDSAHRFRGLGIDVFMGSARFRGPNKIEVDGRELKFKKAIIATGSRPDELDIDGLKQAGYLTSETIFNLTQIPEKLGIIGGGTVGCEIAQAFRRLGCDVYLFHNNIHILDQEDTDAAEIIQEKFIDEGIKLFLNSDIVQVEKKDNKKEIIYRDRNKIFIAEVDEILLATGKVPNVDKLILESAGIEFDRNKGIKINERLQTSNKNVYAVGDVSLKHKFTHTAEFAAKIAVGNALFWRRKKINPNTIPWVTYTDPEIAHVGMYEHDAMTKKIKFDVYTKNFNKIDRALIEGDDSGFIKILTKKGSDKIIGATIVGKIAGEMINEITLAMSHNVGLKKITNVIHPYPTTSEAIKQIGEDYNQTRLTPFVRKILKWLLLI